MKLHAYLIVVFVLFAGGCAHNPDRASSTDPSLLPLSPQSAPADSTPGQKPLKPQEISGKPESMGIEVKGKTDDMPDQPGGNDENLGDYTGEEETAITIPDPLEPFNRAMFQFDDMFYSLVLKPVSQGYGKIMPEFARIGVQNFFYNLRFPTRFVSCLLQARFKASAQELGRFTLNTIWGLGGLLDPASDKSIDIPKHSADLGQTLGVYGVGHGFYIVWPFVGSSSARDSVDFAGDYYLYPVSYVLPWYASLGIREYEVVNYTSLNIGDYESLKGASIDHYEAVRNAYAQFRQKVLEEGKMKNGRSDPAGVRSEDAGGLQ